MDIEEFITQRTADSNNRQKLRHERLRRFSADGLRQKAIDALLAELVEIAKKDIPEALHPYVDIRVFNELKDTAITINLPQCTQIWRWYKYSEPRLTEWVLNMKGESVVSYVWFDAVTDTGVSLFPRNTIYYTNIADAVALARRVWHERVDATP